MKIYWQIKKKWQVILKITAKTCITLRRLPVVLPTSGPIPRVLGCGLTAHFEDSNIRILPWRQLFHNHTVTASIVLEMNSCNNFTIRFKIKSPQKSFWILHKTTVKLCMFTYTYTGSEFRKNLFHCHMWENNKIPPGPAFPFLWGYPYIWGYPYK